MWYNDTMLSELTLNKITAILKNEGCREIFLFGSHATGRAHENSDIGIGIRGHAPDGL